MTQISHTKIFCFSFSLSLFPSIKILFLFHIIEIAQQQKRTNNCLFDAITVNSYTSYIHTTHITYTRTHAPHGFLKKLCLFFSFVFGIFFVTFFGCSVFTGYLFALVSSTNNNKTFVFASIVHIYFVLTLIQTNTQLIATAKKPKYKHTHIHKHTLDILWNELDINSIVYLSGWCLWIFFLGAIIFTVWNSKHGLQPDNLIGNLWTLVVAFCISSLCIHDRNTCRQMGQLICVFACCVLRLLHSLGGPLFDRVRCCLACVPSDVSRTDQEIESQNERTQWTDRFDYPTRHARLRTTENRIELNRTGHTTHVARASPWNGF